MNKKIGQLFTISFMVMFIASPFVFAEDTSTSTSDTSSSSQLEITFPMQKDDFLLFYGVTKDTDINTKIDSIRKDFMDKFQALKDDYTKSINDTIGDNILNSPIPLDTKDTTRVIAKTKKTDSKILIKKYSLKTDTASSTDIIISPVVNTLDTSSGIHTDDSTWFQKVKSIFNW